MAWGSGCSAPCVSLWWVVGLQVEAAYGVNVLKYTETVPSTSGDLDRRRRSSAASATGTSTARTSSGRGPRPSVRYTQDIWLLAPAFAVPALAFVAAAFVALARTAAYFVLLFVVGMVLAVGPVPYDDPSAVGSVLKAFMTDTTAGLALRSTDRATPLVSARPGHVARRRRHRAVARRFPRTGLVVGGAGRGRRRWRPSTPLSTGATIANSFTQPAAPPAYVPAGRGRTSTAPTPAPGSTPSPGNNFAAYRWGDTIDTVYPGLLTRPFVTHEQQIMGSLATADTL